MKQQIETVRALAAQYAEFAHNPRNAEKIRLYKAVNDLHMIRPVVLIDEIPWPEMDPDGEMKMVCTDERLYRAEWYLRKQLFRLRHFPADMVAEPFFPVPKISDCTGWGVEAQEHTIGSNARQGIIAHEYLDQFASDEDLNKLRVPQYTYRKDKTEALVDFYNEVFGDILPARAVGGNVHFGPWDLISRWRGVTPLLIDLAERPEFCHAMMRFLTDAQLDITRQWEEQGILEPNMTTIHCTPASTDHLRVADPTHAKTGECWGRGVAQIFGSVSKAMHEEFDIEYQIEVLKPFGLNYYGCCEPLDRKIDIVSRIPNLRKVSITPWADVDVAAEAIGKKYVLSNKPNPANVAVGFDEDVVRAEIGRILDACRRNGCAVDITLKDISSAGKDPRNLEKWERLVMSMVENY